MANGEQRGQLSAKVQAQLGLPEGIKFYSPFPFAGMNTNASSIAIDDKQFVYAENFFHLGDGKLRTAWDQGRPVYTAPSGTTIVYHNFFTVASNYYAAVFLSDGSAIQIDMATLAQTQIGPPGTFYTGINPGNLPFLRQWGSTYALICNRNTTHDYWAWDSKLFYQPGTAAPLGVHITGAGAGYTSPPTVTAFGGTGGGMQLEPTIRGGQVVSVKITDPGQGYIPGDVVQLAFSGGGNASVSPILYGKLSFTTVGSVSVLSGGSGYTVPPQVILLGGQLNPTSPFYYTFFGQTMTVYSATPADQATAQAIIQDGQVVDIIVTHPGSLYDIAPIVVLVGGDGFGASAYASLTPSGLASVLISNGGLGFTATVPTATVVGGGGAGATVTLSVLAGAINGVVVNTPGKNYTNAPAIVVGAGANNSAYATVDLWPWGVSGSAMETYLSRVWIVDPALQPGQTIPPGNLYNVSAPGSVIDFATSSGGVGGQNTDAFLQTKYMNVRQIASYLYFLGDGSISVVSNVSTSGVPATTTYQYQNLDSQSGESWRDSVQEFDRALIVANETGFYGVLGGTAKKISDDLNGFLDENVIFPSQGGVTPSSALATVHNVKHYFNLFTISDPDTGQTRNAMTAFNGKEWTIASQSVDLVQISTQKVGSVYKAWGTDGASLYPLFDTPSSALQKRLDTKVYGADTMLIQKQAQATWLQVQDMTNAQVGVSGTFEMAVSGIGVQNNQYPSLQNGVYHTFNEQPNLQAPAPFWSLWGTSMGGIYFTSMGLRFTSNSPDFTIGNLTVGYLNAQAYFGQ